jgi:hypothetical protein
MGGFEMPANQSPDYRRAASPVNKNRSMGDPLTRCPLSTGPPVEQSEAEPLEVADFTRDEG